MPREPLVSDRWTERFVNAASASCGPSEDALASSHSIMEISSVASFEECAALHDHATAVASRERVARQKSGPAYGTDGMRYDGRTGRIRGPVKELLDEQSQELCDTILMRVVAELERQMPALVPRLFGAGVLLRSILHNAQLAFSPGEPAINVYTAGGNFDAHTDKQSLTILVPLSRPCGASGTRGGIACDAPSEADPADFDALSRPCGASGTRGGIACDAPSEADPADFDGGGTAFWNRPVGSDCTMADLGDPELVVRPTPGTAIVFGGQMTHAGLGVLTGQRCVLVASFSAKVLVTGDDDLRSRWATPVLPVRIR